MYQWTNKILAFKANTKTNRELPLKSGGGVDSYLNVFALMGTHIYGTIEIKLLLKAGPIRGFFLSMQG